MPLLGLDSVKKMIAKNKKESNVKVRGVFLAGLESIIEGTPVGLTQSELPKSVDSTSGFHRNNWFLSVKIPSRLVGRDSADSGSGSFLSAATMPDYVLNKKIYFSNNSPAINTLEKGGFPNPVKKGTRVKGNTYQKLSSDGFSKQAPNGWVRKTLIAMANKIRSL